MKYINQFFWWCAGANIKILKDSPVDHAKYFGLGGTILFTALMASFAGGYAFFTAFDNVGLSCLFAAFWGAMIFNLDRFIVSSAGKGDGTVKITKEEWQNSLPRIILALIIGFIIAVPLELKVFQKEIDVEITKMINEERKNIKAGYGDLRNDIQKYKDKKVELDNELENVGNALNGSDFSLQNSQKEYSGIDKEIVQKELAYNKAKRKYDEGKSRFYRYNKQIKDAEDNNEYIDEVTLQAWKTKRYTGRKLRDQYKPVVKSLSKELNDLKTNKSKLSGKLTSIKDNLETDYNTTYEKIKNEKVKIDEKIADLESILDSKVQEADDTAIKFDGFMAQLIALDRLSIKRDTVRRVLKSTSADAASETPPSSYQDYKIEESKTPVWYAKWMISILLICIEIAPILFKMMTESGPYDDRLEELRYASELSKRKFISDANSQVNMELKLATQKQSDKIAEELKANEEILNAVAQAQAEIATKAIEVWKKEQLKNIGTTANNTVKSV